MIRILFLCLISTKHALSQSVSWTVGTSVPKFNEDLKLVCTVSSGCCTSSDRIWADGTGTQILNNGNSATPNKYAEEWNTSSTTEFSLIIKNLQLSDVGVDYDCQYKLGNDKHTLTQDDTWEYIPSSQENCPIKWSKGGLTGTLDIARSAPSPTVFASYRGQNVTSDLTLNGPKNISTWFYSLRVSIDKITCIHNARFMLIVITGTSTTEICDAVIPCSLCYECGGRCLGWGCIGVLLAVCFFAGLRCKYLDIELRIAVLIAAVSTFTGFYCNCCIALPVGFYSCICYGSDHSYDPFYILVVVLIICAFLIVYLCRNLTCTGHGIKEYMLRNYLYFLTLGLLFVYDWCNGDEAVLGSEVQLECPYKAANGKHITWHKVNDGNTVRYSEEEEINSNLPTELKNRLKVTGDHKKGNYHLSISDVQESDKGTYQCSLSETAGAVYRLKLTVKGGNTQSPESGSSCWPSCKLGQDPDTTSHYPRNLGRSIEGPRAKKEKEEKPVARVRSQPQKAHHVKTENTARAVLSAENEIFKPRPLPSIILNTDAPTPRPLPNMPLGTQQEKGGKKLEPIDPTSKKRKKKKKKETEQTKQIEVENSTEL